MKPTYVDRPAALKRIVDQRLNTRLVRGTVRTIISEGEFRLMLAIDGGLVSISSYPRPPQISPGDSVALLVTPQTFAKAYYNETTGASNLERLRDHSGKFGLWGSGFAAVALAIFGTVVIGTSRETLFPCCCTRLSTCLRWSAAVSCRSLALSSSS
jgi:hypothetical protein